MMGGREGWNEGRRGKVSTIREEGLATRSHTTLSPSLSSFVPTLKLSKICSGRYIALLPVSTNATIEEGLGPPTAA